MRASGVCCDGCWRGRPSCWPPAAAPSWTRRPGPRSVPAAHQSGCVRRCRCCCAGSRLRRNRPLLAKGDPAVTLRELMEARYPIYAEADIVVDCTDDTPDQTMGRVAAALRAWQPPHRLPVRTSSGTYDVVIGSGMLRRAGALLAPVLPQRRAVVITDTTVSALHAPDLMAGLAEAGFEATLLEVPPGEEVEVAGSVRRVGGPCAGGRRGAADRGDGAGRRRGGRPGGLRAAAVALRGPAVRASADDPPGAGGFQRRRQDRNQYQPRQEPGGRVLPPKDGDRRHGHARDLAGAGEARRVCRGREGRV